MWAYSLNYLNYQVPCNKLIGKGKKTQLKSQLYELLGFESI